MGLYPSGPVLAESLFMVGQTEAAVRVAQQAAARAESRGHKVALVDALRVRGLVTHHAEDLREALDLARAMGYPFGEERVVRSCRREQATEPAAQR